MGFRESQAKINRRLEAKTDLSQDPLELGFGASMEMSFDQFRAEDISNSESRAVQRFLGDRNNTLDQMVADGEIPEDIVEQNKRVARGRTARSKETYKLDYHALAAWSNENTGSSFDVDDSEMIEVMRRERLLRERQLANGNAAGKFLGSVGAAMTDPLLAAITVATLPVSGGAIPASVISSTVARVAVVEGIIGMVSEVPIQAQTLDFKERIDSPYTFEDAVNNVLLAGAGGAALGGTLQFGIEKAVKYFLNEPLSKRLDQIPADTPEEFDRELRRVERAYEEDFDLSRQVDTALSTASRPIEYERRDVDRRILSEEIDQLPVGKEGELRSDDDYLPDGELSDAQMPVTYGDHYDRLLGAEKGSNQPEIPEPLEADAGEVTWESWEPNMPEDWDDVVTLEDGTQITLREQHQRYEAELAEGDRRVEALAECRLL